MPNKPKTHKPPRSAARKDARPSAARRGYDHKWRAFRLAYLAEHPLCVDCDSNGFVTPAVHVDHVVALKKGGDKYDEANLEALCHSCHSRKTCASGEGSFGRKGKGHD